MANPILYYIHDPMCSWCWGFQQSWQEIQQQLNGAVDIDYVLGGLAPDSDMPMPGNMQQRIEATWQRIQQVIPVLNLIMTFGAMLSLDVQPIPLAEPVLAAVKRQGSVYETAMTRQIQESYYLQAKNPSDIAATLTEQSHKY